jgi:hypothetical protein
MEARKILNKLHQELEKTRNKKQITLVSTITTWQQTHQSSSVITDMSYRKRPHPCFTNHLALERDVINLSRKHKELVSSVVVCPGIVCGEKQDIFHFIYDKCFFNNVQLVFASSNYLPVIHTKDFTAILLEVIRNPPEASYLLVVQPEPMEAKNLVSNSAEVVCGPETRARFCNGEDIRGETMTVSEGSWENAISPIAQSSSRNVSLIKFH